MAFLRSRLFVLALMPWLAVLGGCAAREPLSLLSYDKIEIDDAIEQIASDIVVDSPVLSADGSEIAVQVELYRHPFLPYEVYSLALLRQLAGDWQAPRMLRQGRHRPLGQIEMYIQPAIDSTTGTVYVTHLQIDCLFGMPLLATLRSRIESLPLAGGPATAVVEHQPWNLAANEIIQHVRISPDGRWLTFYTRVHRKDQGVYLLDLESGRKFRLSSHHDKHPTWGPDGRRIYFHTQFGGPRHRFDTFRSGQEQSIVGYFSLHFDDSGELVDWERVMLDDPADGHYRYHKHPAEVSGTGLLFFHGETKPDGRKKLMVRRAEAGSEVFVVKPRWTGGKIKELKHPCASYHRSDLVFIAKLKGNRYYDRLMSLTSQAISEIRRRVFAAESHK